MAYMLNWTYVTVPMRGFICVLSGLLLVGCASTRGFEYAKEPDPRSLEYVVGPADQLRINVWRDNELSLELRVRPDGTITLPLVGDIKAAGRTPSQIRDDVSQKLTAYVKSDTAKVTVAVVAVNSYKFSVAGNVEHPGLFSSPYFVTVLEAMAMAGGPNRFAAPDRAVIVRTYSPGRSRQIPIDYDTLKNGEQPEQNIVVLSGDTIYVP
jgi:polysaccharide export outer membrane protein